MTDESHFQAALDADPTDSAMRLVFADWLEERGDWRAAGVRWMGEMRKWPQVGSSWDWYPTKFGFGIGEEHELPCKAFDGSEMWMDVVKPHFKSRRAAEEALCKVIYDHLQAGKPVPMAA